MDKRWRIHPHDAADIARLQHSAGVSPVVAQLLICRGVRDPEAARMFVDAKLTGLRDPEPFPGLRVRGIDLDRSTDNDPLLTRSASLLVESISGQ